LVESDVLLELADVLVEGTSDIFSISENEGSFGVEADSKNVLAVFNSIVHVFLKLIIG
jgi:hypothetical protein